MKDLPGEAISMTYTNWRGETARRTVVPVAIRFGTTAWHKEPGWLMHAYDLDRDDFREFALSDCNFSGGTSDV